MFFANKLQLHVFKEEEPEEPIFAPKNQIILIKIQTIQNPFFRKLKNMIQLNPKRFQLNKQNTIIIRKRNQILTELRILIITNLQVDDLGSMSFDFEVLIVRALKTVVNELDEPVLVATYKELRLDSVIGVFDGVI
jgi:hypothetical protein